MSDNQEKEGVVIDVTPEQEEQPSAPESTPEQEKTPVTKPKRSTSALVALFAASLALVIIGVSAVLGYRYWQDLQQQLGALKNQVSTTSTKQHQLKDAIEANDQKITAQSAELAKQTLLSTQHQEAVDSAKDSYQAQKQLLADESLEMQAREAELRATVADVHRRVGRSGTQWMVAEAEFLMNIASHRLALSRDPETARVALVLADQRLRDTLDPGWNSTREQLARDIVKLSSVKTADTVGISAKLRAIAEQIPQFALANADSKEAQPQNEESTTSNERNWDTLVNDLTDGFKNAIRIRKRDTPINAMLAPEHQFFLYENLKLNIEASRLALVSMDATLYRDNLAAAQTWLKNHFDQDDALTTNALSTLTQLASIDIVPAMPDISQSRHSLDVRKQLMTASPNEESEEAAK